jgi:hypothetical protein
LTRNYPLPVFATRARQWVALASAGTRRHVRPDHQEERLINGGQGPAARSRAVSDSRNRGSRASTSGSLNVVKRPARVAVTEADSDDVNLPRYYRDREPADPTSSVPLPRIRNGVEPIDLRKAHQKSAQSPARDNAQWLKEPIHINPRINIRCKFSS